MAPALTAITDRVHFAYTDLVNWTLVTDDDGVMLIDAGFPGSRDDVLGVAAPARLRRRRPPRDPVDARPHRPFRFGHLVRENTWHTGVFATPPRSGTPSGSTSNRRRPPTSPMHIWQPRWLKWSVAITRKGAMTRDGIPTTQALTEDVAAGLPGAPMADSDARPHRRALLVRGRRCARRGRRVGDGPPAVDDAAARSCCRTCSTTTRTAACAASPRWGCWTPRCCCPGTGRCGGDRSARPPRKPERRRPHDQAVVKTRLGC